MREMYCMGENDVDIHIFSLLPPVHKILHQEARELLREIRQRLAVGLGPKTVTYRFQYTDMWDECQRFTGEPQVEADGDGEPG